MEERRVALVTGASRGIGRGIALRLAKDGFNVVINYNSSEKEAMDLKELISKEGVEALVCKADVSDSKQVKEMFKEIVKHFGRVDVLVNNAGIVSDSFLVMQTPSLVDKIFDINVKSYFFCVKEAALKMMSKKSGKIINISSISGTKAVAGQSMYSATKGAINSLTKTLALELAPYGIEVNGIAPGFVNTEILNHISDELKQKYIELLPAKRFAEIDEVAELVSFLAKKEVSYIRGQTIIMDGGLSL